MTATPTPTPPHEEKRNSTSTPQAAESSAPQEADPPLTMPFAAESYAPPNDAPQDPPVPTNPYVRQNVQTPQTCTLREDEERCAVCFARSGISDAELRADLTPAEFETLTLAATLLVRLGLLTPRQAFEHEQRDRTAAAGRRKKLGTPRQILRELERVTAAIADGNIDAKQGRTVLYGLQTLLVAHRVAAEAEAAELPQRENGKALNP